tara:strand:+ start:1136 stop:3493 length:2358 start_codon:yes stop_codon:yes gene_type:complete
MTDHKSYLRAVTGEDVQETPELRELVKKSGAPTYKWSLDIARSKKWGKQQISNEIEDNGSAAAANLFAYCDDVDYLAIAHNGIPWENPEDDLRSFVKQDRPKDSLGRYKIAMSTICYLANELEIYSKGTHSPSSYLKDSTLKNINANDWLPYTTLKGDKAENTQISKELERLRICLGEEFTTIIKIKKSSSIPNDPINYHQLLLRTGVEASPSGRVKLYEINDYIQPDLNCKTYTRDDIKVEYESPNSWKLGGTAVKKSEFGLFQGPGGIFIGNSNEKLSAWNYKVVLAGDDKGKCYSSEAANHEKTRTWANLSDSSSISKEKSYKKIGTLVIESQYTIGVKTKNRLLMQDFNKKVGNNKDDACKCRMYWMTRCYCEQSLPTEVDYNHKKYMASKVSIYPSDDISQDSISSLKTVFMEADKSKTGSSAERISDIIKDVRQAHYMSNSSDKLPISIKDIQSGIVNWDDDYKGFKIDYDKAIQKKGKKNHYIASLRTCGQDSKGEKEALRQRYIKFLKENDSILAGTPEVIDFEDSEEEIILDVEEPEITVNTQADSCSEGSEDTNLPGASTSVPYPSSDSAAIDSEVSSPDSSPSPSSSDSDQVSSVSVSSDSPPASGKTKKKFKKRNKKPLENGDERNPIFKKYLDTNPQSKMIEGDPKQVKYKIYLAHCGFSDDTESYLEIKANDNSYCMYKIGEIHDETIPRRFSGGGLTKSHNYGNLMGLVEMSSKIGLSKLIDRETETINHLKKFAEQIIGKEYLLVEKKTSKIFEKEFHDYTNQFAYTDS